MTIESAATTDIAPMGSTLHPWLGEARFVMRRKWRPVALLTMLTLAVALAEAFALTPALDRYVEQYSLGMQQKLGILLGLLGEPPLRILDEPFTGLDPRSAMTLKNYLRSDRDAAAALIATHSLDFAQRHATRTILMIDGELRQQWSRQELDALNADPARSLEQAMAEALS